MLQSFSAWRAALLSQSLTCLLFLQGNCARGSVLTCAQMAVTSSQHKPHAGGLSQLHSLGSPPSTNVCVRATEGAFWRGSSSSPDPTKTTEDWRTDGLKNATTDDRRQDKCKRKTDDEPDDRTYDNTEEIESGRCLLKTTAVRFARLPCPKTAFFSLFLSKKGLPRPTQPNLPFFRYFP